MRKCCKPALPADAVWWLQEKGTGLRAWEVGFTRCYGTEDDLHQVTLLRSADDCVLIYY